MKFKKVLVIPALALAATCFLTACGTKKDSKKEEVKEIKMSDIKDDAVSKKQKWLMAKKLQNTPQKMET